ncbi:MAG TPA: hypothetical protein VGV63_05755 [Acidimicrobiales bacterium]|nr:hypothetical protein [Acidimicrobiales bacterium]
MTAQVQGESGSAPGGHGPVTPPRPPKRQVGLVVALTLATVLVLVLVGTVVFGRGEPEPAGPAATGPNALVGDDYVLYEDAEAGFRLQHPKTWVPIARAQGDLRLQLGAGDGSSLRVRVSELEGVVDSSNVEDLRAVTSGIVGSPDPNVEKQFLKEDSYSVNGMPGYYYVYRLRDKQSGLEAVNAHYFLFQGRKLNMLVFQALSADDFERRAPEFDRVLATFESDPVPEAG